MDRDGRFIRRDDFGVSVDRGEVILRGILDAGDIRRIACAIPFSLRAFVMGRSRLLRELFELRRHGQRRIITDSSNLWLSS